MMITLLLKHLEGNNNHMTLKKTFSLHKIWEMMFFKASDLFLLSRTTWKRAGKDAMAFDLLVIFSLFAMLHHQMPSLVSEEGEEKEKISA